MRLVECMFIVCLILRNLQSEGVSGIIYYFKSVSISYLFYATYIARLTIAVNRHNGRGLRRDGRLNLLRVKVARPRVDVNEYRLASGPPDGVGSGHEAVRSRDDLPSDSQCLKGGKKRKRTISKEAYLVYAQIALQRSFKLFVEVTVVGNPPRVPDLFKQFVEFVKIGEQRTSYCN